MNPQVSEHAERNPHNAIPSVNGLALSESALARYSSFAALYFSQGVPVALLVTALPAWLAKQGLGTAEIGGFVALVTLPWSLKLVWGPLLDRFSFLLMGRRRPWIILAQIGLLVSFLALAFVPEPTANLRWLSIVGFLISMFASLQDVAVDGMAIDVLPVHQQGRANGIMFGAQRLGLAAAAAGGAVLLNVSGFGVVALVGAGCIGIVLLFPLFLRERPGERLLPWSQGQASEAALQLQQREWKAIVGGVLRTVLLPASLLVIGFCFIDRIGFGILLAVRPVVYVQTLGWTDTQYTQLLAGYGLMNAIGAIVIGSTIVDRLGPLRTLVFAFFLEALVNAGMGLASPFWSNRTVVGSFVLLAGLIEGTGLVSRAALFMTMCGKQVAATQFALYMALAGNLGMPVGSRLAGPVDRLLDYPRIFLAIAGLQIAMAVGLRLVNLHGHYSALATLEERRLTTVTEKRSV